MGRVLWGNAAASALLFASMSCTALFDEERLQCRDDSQCERAQGTTCVEGLCVPRTLAPRWRCIDGTYPPPAEVVVSGFVTDSVANLVIPGARVRACAADELDCSTVLAEAEADATGAFRIALPSGFGGAIRYEAADYMPVLDFATDWRLSKQVYSRQDLVMATPGTHQAVGLLLGVRSDDQRGTIFVTAHDCDGSTAEGLRFEYEGLDEHSVSGVVRDGLPSTTAVLTEPSGLGFAANVPPGRVVVRAVDGDTSRSLTELEVIVRAGVITGARLYVPFELDP